MASAWALGRVRAILPERLLHLVVAKSPVTGNLPVIIEDMVAACLDDVRADYETSDLTTAIQERAEFKDQRDALAKQVADLKALVGPMNEVRDKRNALTVELANTQVERDALATRVRELENALETMNEKVASALALLEARGS